MTQPQPPAVIADDNGLAPDQSLTPILPSARLRAETEHEHQELESSRSLTRLSAPDLTPTEYGEILSRFHLLHEEWEKLLQSKGHPPGFEDFIFTPRTPLLKRDLAGLGIDAPKVGQKTFISSRITSQLELIGALYVIEGSNLGAAVLASELERRHEGRLPVDFFRGPHERRGQAWKDVVSRLDSALTKQAEIDSAVEGAKKVFLGFFQCFNQPLQQGDE